jgi:transcriptional regulator with XRE-family HTH domain
MIRYPCRVRSFRKAAGLSQRQLARLIGLKSQGQVSDIETGRKGPGLATILACVIVFDCSVGELFPTIWSQARYDIRTAARALRPDSARGAASVKTLARRLGSPPARL